MSEFKDRPKAFWGAVIGAAASLAGNLINGMSANKEAKRQQEQQEYQNRLREAANLNQGFNNTEYINDFRDRFTYKLGGNVAPRNESKPAVNFRDRLPKLRVRGSQR